ncbi:MAG: hypothetical protein IJP78_08545 [Clostridia bacterium]|nr:hypothetical protein [Clostridia bacterium]
MAAMTRQSTQENRFYDFLGFVRFLLKKWKLIAGVMCASLIVSAIAVFFVIRPMYEATSQIYVVNSQDSVINLSDLQIGSYLTSDYQWMFQTWEVNQTVINHLNLSYTVKQMKEHLSVSNPNNTRVLTITFSSPSASEAAAVANEYASVVSQYISDAMLTSKPTTISVALEPLAPSRPRKMLIMGASTILAGLMAVWCLFIAYICDDKIKTADDLYKYMGVEPLSEIPCYETIEKDRHLL